jgi:hypothetical protein
MGIAAVKALTEGGSLNKFPTPVDMGDQEGDQESATGLRWVLAQTLSVQPYLPQ